MDKIKNFDIVVNTCLADIESRSKKSDFDKMIFCCLWLMALKMGSGVKIFFASLS